MSSKTTNDDTVKNDVQQQPQQQQPQKQKQQPITQELKDFYSSHNLDLSAVLKSSSSESPFPYRFVRLNPRFDREESIKLLEKEVKSKPLLVTWVGEEWGFYALPPIFPLASSACFKNGRVYGMDVSSGAGTAALFSDCQKGTCSKNITNDNSNSNSNSSDEIRILDLCCCPGLKLCAMADFWKTRANSTATVVGVDISEHRMALCKKIVQKYHIHKESSGSGPVDQSTTNQCNIQLYCQDGTTFGMNEKDNNLVFDSRAALEDEVGRGKRKRMNKSARGRERKRLRQLATSDWACREEHDDGDGDGDDDDGNKKEGNPNLPQIKPFDYVLVDAECSTDGSLKHMRERLKESSPEEQESNTLLTDKQQLADLVDLQKRLLASGFRLLRPGGVLVYSTCSLSQDQNEGVVEWLLEQQKDDAYIIKVEFPDTSSSKLVAEGSIEGTLRFYPNLIGQEDSIGFYGDGFFVAKIGKR
jgi:16S rRNA C967 or C1407 C5-methylase (RsmB/RsmF family)